MALIVILAAIAGEITMRFRTIAILSVLFAGMAFGQGDKGTLQGTVSDPVGVALANAPVQARNARTGTIYKATSTATGSYSLADLPGGQYDVTVTIPGLKGFERKGVAVLAAKTQQLDIRLEETTQLGTLGEDTLAIQADAKKHAPPSGPTPRMADGKPDLSGTWWSPRTVDPGKPEWLPAAVAVAKQRADNNRVDSPQARCLPSPVLRLGPVYALVQSAGMMVEISDDDSPGFHQIYIDGRAHPKDPMVGWYGHNVGHWEGDTLVIDRIGFNDVGWLDQEAHPHSEKLHVVERYRRPDLGHLETEITVEDPEVLAKPYTIKRVSDLAPTEDIFEFICPENNRDVVHLVGK
jgi:Carboxypeptidase regulatory-like domain